ncbi:hypothetical protein Plhal304r1_c004g0014901 [Plasmopara halstedii]
MDSATPHSPTLALGGLPDLTRRLQDERDALRVEMEELTRRLSQERVARSTLENEAQLRELELRQVQQRSSQATQQARDKQMALEKELEEEVAMHKMAVLGRNAATQKNTALAAELKTMEVKWKKEIEKKEIAVAEADLAAGEIQKLQADRNQLVQRTESDAKRIRELWQQITREHEVKVEALMQELQNARQKSTTLEAAIAISHREITMLKEQIQTMRDAKAVQKECPAAVKSERLQTDEQQDLDRMKMNTIENEKHRTILKWRQALSDCKLYAQREVTAVKERDAAVLAARNIQKVLEDRNEEVLALKTELTILLDKHELLVTQYKQSARDREAQMVLRTQKLRDSKRYAKELSQLRKKEVLGYKQVIYAVNARLNEVQELSKATQSNAWSLPPDISKSRKSLCIISH